MAGPQLSLCVVADSSITCCVAHWELLQCPGLLHQVPEQISSATCKKWGTIQKAGAGVEEQPAASRVCSMREGYENALPVQSLFHTAPCWGPTESRAYSCQYETSS